MRPARESDLSGFGDVVKTSELPAPRQMRSTCRTISVLSYDDLRLRLLVIRHFTVLFGTEQEQYDVRVLFERP